MTGVEELVAGRYRITGPLGVGGMGRVWLAFDESLRRQVAIKKCAPPDGLNEDEQRLVRDWTVRDARAVARVRHPNVVRIHDVLTGDDQPWIVMEYVPARSLLQLINEDGALPAGRVARIGLRVLQALNAARRMGVLHLDVKPGNVLVADDGRIMLTDFGPAVTDAGIDALNRAGVILGSPNYVAPERLLDGVTTAQADLWSLGATLYHAVEGKPPYARKTITATLKALGDGDSPDPQRLAGALGPVLDGLLQRDPADRIGPAEAEDRLRRLAGGQARDHPRPLAHAVAAGLRQVRAHPVRAVRPGQRQAPPEPVSDAASPPSAVAAARRPPGVSPAGETDLPYGAGWRETMRAFAGSVLRRARARVAVFAALFAVLAVLAVLAVVAAEPDGSDRARAQAGAPGPPTTQPAAPSPDRFVLPPDYSWWNDPSGFGMAVPSGWPHRRNGRDAVQFTAPGGRSSLRVSTWPQSTANPVALLIGQERDVKLAGYRRIRIEALPAPGDAVWEYTFKDPRAGQVRALERIVARDGHSYRVEWHTPSKAWADELQKLEVVVDSLRPLPGR